MTNNRLNLVILPTEDCNFRCSYCYEDYKVNEMSETTLNGIMNLLRVRGPELTNFSISWFGGEPLLAYRKIVRLMEFCSKEMPHATNYEFKSNITTNGSLLTPLKMKKLVSLGITLYQITLDGGKEIHDKFRVTKLNRGTFQMIVGNLKRVSELKLDFKIILRVHITRDNVNSIRSLIYELSSFLKGDQRFLLYLRGLSRLGGEHDSELPIADGGFIERYSRDLAELAKKLGIYSNIMDSNMLNKFGLKNLSRCYASSPNSLVVRADGSLSKCTVAFNEKINDIGIIHPNGKMELDANKFIWWIRGNMNGSPKSLACPLKADV